MCGLHRHFHFIVHSMHHIVVIELRHAEISRSSRHDLKRAQHQLPNIQKKFGFLAISKSSRQYFIFYKHLTHGAVNSKLLAIETIGQELIFFRIDELVPWLRVCRRPVKQNGALWRQKMVGKSRSTTRRSNRRRNSTRFKRFPLSATWLMTALWVSTHDRGMRLLHFLNGLSFISFTRGNRRKIFDTRYINKNDAGLASCIFMYVSYWRLSRMICCMNASVAEMV